MLVLGAEVGSPRPGEMVPTVPVAGQDGASSSFSVGKAEVELAGDEVDDGDEVVDIAMAAGAGLGRLDEAVEPLRRVVWAKTRWNRQ